MGDSRKKYEEQHIFWEEQDVRVNNRRVYMNPRIASAIIDRALLEIKDAELGEDLEAVQEWINKQ